MSGAVAAMTGNGLGKGNLIGNRGGHRKGVGNVQTDAQQDGWAQLIAYWQGVARRPLEKTCLHHVQHCRGSDADKLKLVKPGLPWLAVASGVLDAGLAIVAPVFQACFGNATALLAAMLDVGIGQASCSAEGHKLYMPTIIYEHARRLCGGDAFQHERLAVYPGWPIPLPQLAMPIQDIHTAAGSRCLEALTLDAAQIVTDPLAVVVTSPAEQLHEQSDEADSDDPLGRLLASLPDPWSRLRSLLSHGKQLVDGPLQLLARIAWRTRGQDVHHHGHWNGFVMQHFFSTQLCRTKTDTLLLKAGWLDVVAEAVGGQSGVLPATSSLPIEQLWMQAAGHRLGHARIGQGAQATRLLCYDIASAGLPPAWQWLMDTTVQAQIPVATWQAAPATTV